MENYEEVKRVEKEEKVKRLEQIMRTLICKDIVMNELLNFFKMKNYNATESTGENLVNFEATDEEEKTFVDTD
uniref:Uncharacterized protein n=1 Tax=Parastrongyloides trichosuri TaxID=131310 RepID=A0A0N5A4B5_PARTI